MRPVPAIFIAIKIFYFIFQFVDYLYLSKRKFLPECYRYKCSEMISNLFQSNIYFYRKFIVLIPVVGFLSPSFIYSLGLKSSLNFKLWHKDILLWGLIFLVIDFFYYIWHVTSHRFGLFWFFHQVHHQDPGFNLLTMQRVGIFEIISIGLFILPVSIIGAPVFAAFTSLAIINAYMGWIHSSIPRLPKFLEYILNTPVHHRAHHEMKDASRQGNYGGMFIVWDRIFGTFRESEEYPKKMGIMGFPTYASPIRDCLFGVLKKEPIDKNKAYLSIDWHLVLWALFLSTFHAFQRINPIFNITFPFLLLFFLEFKFFIKNKITISLFRIITLIFILFLMVTMPKISGRMIIYFLSSLPIYVLLYVSLYISYSRESRNTVNSLIES